MRVPTSALSGSLCALLLLALLAPVSFAQTLPPLCSVPPVSMPLGGGCGVPSAPVLTITPPTIGTDVLLTVTSDHPFAPMYLMWSYGTVTPFIIPGLPCVVHVDFLNPNNFFLMPFFLDSNGDFSVTVAIPYDLNAVGTEVTFQARTWFPGGPVPEGDHLSGGVFVRFGCPARIGDTVWCDLDDDGIQDPGEPGVPDITITMDCTNGESRTAVTDANGYYLFDNIPVTPPGTVCTVSMDTSTIPVDKVPGNNCPLTYQVPITAGTEFLDADFCIVPCQECDGKVTALTMKYLGSATASIRVEQKDGNITVFNATVQPDEIFSFVHDPSTDNFGNEVKIFKNGSLDVAIHTSCSQPIGPGVTFGDYEVIAGASENGGPLCPCTGCCAGKPCSLVVKYTGESCSASNNMQNNATCSGNPNMAASVYIRSNDDNDPFDTDKVWFEGVVALDGIFSADSLAAGEDKLKSNTWFHIFSDNNGSPGSLLQSVNAHTSCSQPLRIGDQFGSILLVGYGAEGTCVPGVGQDSCAIGKPRILTFDYTAEGCGATNNSQSSTSCTMGAGASAPFPPTVMVLATDDDDPNASNASVWFTGPVTVGVPFDIDAGNAGEGKLDSNTYIYVFDDVTGQLLQSIRLHTSCSQPLIIGEQWGSMVLSGFAPEL